MKIKSKLWLRSIGLLALSVLMFTLSSKGPKPPPDQPNSYCDDLSYDDLTININFDPSTNSNSIPGRNDFYEYYIPENDIRNGHLAPAADLSENDTYYGVVTVTSPECSEFNWTRRISSTNGANMVMDIKVPDAAVKTRI